MKSLAKKILLLVVAAAAPCGTAHGQGGVGTKIRTAGSLPASCDAGSTVALVDYIDVGGQFYRCGPHNNHWTPISAFKGTDPWANITAWGARAVASTPTTIATCTSESHSISLAAASTFQNGDGITLLGCGPALTLRTPSAPTVTPAIAVAGTALGGGTAGGLVVNSGTGSSTYYYKTIFRDKFGGHTAPSAATTITNGLASLGLGSCNVSTYLLSGTSLTVETTGACAGSVAGAKVHLSGASNGLFVGWFNITTRNSSSEFVIANTGFDSAALGWQAGDSVRGTGGVADFYLSNHISVTHQTGMWEAYFCAKRPGDSNYHLIGQTKPSIDSGFWDIQFDDYGSPFNDSQIYPPYIETGTDTPNSNDAICNRGSALNDPLTTTIDSGAGGTTIVVHDAAGNNSSGKTAIFDDGPAILAAANSISAAVSSGTLYIPPSVTETFPINSYTKLPTGIIIKQAGKLILNETMELQEVNWSGDWSDNGLPQFAWGGTASVSVGAANPGIYVGVYGNGVMSHLGLFTSNTNGGTLEVDDGFRGMWDTVNFTSNSGTTTDYLSMGLLLRNIDPAADSTYFFKDSLFSAGPNQVLNKTWTPVLYVPPNQNGSGGLTYNQGDDLRFKDSRWSIRGVEYEECGGRSDWAFDGLVRQGGITPLLTLGNCFGNGTATVKFFDTLQDTESVSTLAIGSTGGTLQVDVEANFLNNGSVDSGSNTPPPYLTGYTPHHFVVDSSGSGRVPNNAGYGMCLATNSTFSQPPPFCMFDPMIMPGVKSYLYWPLAAPTRVSGAVQAGAGVANDTYAFVVTSVGADGNESIASTPSASVTTTRGNDQILVSWTGVAGAISYNLYFCTWASGVCTGAGYFRQTKTGILANRWLWVSADAGLPAPTYTATGITGCIAAGCYAQKFTVTSAVGGRGVSSATTYKNDSSGNPQVSINGASAVNLGMVIASGTATLGTSAIKSGNCATVVTMSATGATTSNNIIADFTADPAGLTGYGVDPNGVLRIYKYITRDKVNFKVCNPATSGVASVTPSAATLHWQVQ